MSAFVSSAEFYEVLANATGRLDREGTFLLASLGYAPRSDARGPRVLELACGVGIHAVFFAEHGAEVTATDLSEGMVAHAKRHRPHPKVAYRVGDMRRIEGGPWDMAMCLGNSLSLLNDESDLAQTFHEVCDHLVSGGVLVTQTLNYQSKSAREPRHRVERAHAEGAEIVAVKSLVPHGNHTLLSLNFFADHGHEITGVSESAVLRNWTQEELAQAGTAIGFRVDGVFGGYDSSPYEPKSSSDVIFRWAKAGA